MVWKLCAHVFKLILIVLKLYLCERKQSNAVICFERNAEVQTPVLNDHAYCA